MNRQRVITALVCLLSLSAIACHSDRTVRLLDSKSLEGWTAKHEEHNRWVIGNPSVDPEDPKRLKVDTTGAALINHLAGAHGSDIYSDAKFGDAIIELEVLVPQGSNSGIYVTGEYEIQVMDNYGKENPGTGDMGAIYSVAPPAVNASKAPGVWQKYYIDFRAARFDEKGNKIRNARFVNVILNGKVIHENLELQDKCPGGLTGREVPAGPLMFQGDHGEVAYRNIKVTPIDSR